MAAMTYFKKTFTALFASVVLLTANSARAADCSQVYGDFDWLVCMITNRDDSIWGSATSPVGVGLLINGCTPSANITATGAKVSDSCTANLGAARSASQGSIECDVTAPNTIKIYVCTIGLGVSAPATVYWKVSKRPL